MTELPYHHRVRTIESAKPFFESTGFEVPEEEIDIVYPSFHHERAVYKTGDSVCKIRRSNEKAQRELEQLTKLFRSYTFSGGHFPDIQVSYSPDGRFVKFTMPHIGYSLDSLAEELDLAEMNGTKPLVEGTFPFSGFTSQHIHDLVMRLLREHELFIRDTGLIHGDLFQMRSANNILYNPSLDRLLLVDAEALGPSDADSCRLIRFYDQMKEVEEWMYKSLLINTAA